MPAGSVPGVVADAAGARTRYITRGYVAATTVWALPLSAGALTRSPRRSYP